MALAPGTHLGPYQITAALGAGGMGEVYRAADTRLGREVAVKVLPSAVSNDPDRLTRFELEARAAAALNHPNILALHDIGVHEGTRYLVTELLEGQTLREALADGAVPVRRAVALATQMAAGLAAAHEKGIVHRDLKPENVFVTPDDRVKILDFGLAKLVQPDSAFGPMSALPTTPAGNAGTASGTVLGTLGYMAPEQVRGLAVDHRADVFAFGAVLHELLSGRRAFQGETPADTMSAILREDPQLPPDRPIPSGLTRIVARCVEKQPAARFQSMRDLAFALDAATTDSGVRPEAPVVQPPTPASRRLTGREAVAWALVVFLAVAGLALFLRLRPGGTSPSARVVFSVQPPEGFTFDRNLAAFNAPALSPDGRRLVFGAVRGSVQMLAVRDLDSLSSRAIPGTEGGRMAFWSPDSESIGFFTTAALKVASVVRSNARTVVEGFRFAATGGSWGGAGTILFTAPDGGLHRASVNGAEAGVVTTPTAPDVAHSMPAFLPDGRRFLYLARPSGTVYLASLDAAGAKLLLQADSRVVFAEPGYLLFVRGTALLAQRFDADAEALQGQPVAIADGIAAFANARTAGAAFAASQSRSLVYRTGLNAPLSRLTWFDRAGKRLSGIGDPARHRQIALSPDGRTVALNLFDDRDNMLVWLLDVSRNVSTRFTLDRAGDPIWSPDSRTLVFTRRNSTVLALQRVDEGQPTTLSDTTAEQRQRYPESWSADGRFIAYEDGNAIGILPTEPGGEPFTWIDTPFDKDEPHFSPDGRWIAYQSSDSGSLEVYVQAFPKPGAQIRVSTAGGGGPRWRADGRELFYLTPEGALMAVAVTPGPAIQFGTPRQLFETPITNLQLNIDQYDVSPDGQRFLILVPEGTDDTPITVMLNWTSGLDGSTPR